MRAVIYTAVFGNYDTLKQPTPQDEPCDFICFTDSKMPSRVGAWRVVQVRPDPAVHPRLQAKYFKLLSHRVFPRGRLAVWYAPFSVRRRADLSIWIDASLQIKCSTFIKDMRVKLDDGDWAMFVHPWNDCIYEEALLSSTLPKYQALPILTQVEAYRPVVPPHGGLYACGVIVRREPSTGRLKRIHDLWWQENLKWTYQDQLSLPYVLQHAGNCEPRHIPGNILYNGWFDFIPHDKNT
jgi:Protein of unknown function (DUF616)